jgi:hypothetical protein
MGKRSVKKHKQFKQQNLRQFVREKRAVEAKHLFSNGNRMPMCQRLNGKLGEIGNDGFCLICDSFNSTFHWETFRNEEEVQIPNQQDTQTNTSAY